MAKAGIESLRLDDKRAGQREPWEKLAAEFRAIYDADPDWPNRAAALFRAAESLEELARRSFAKADARKAIECYESLALRHADSRLADDALLQRGPRCAPRGSKTDKGALALLKRSKANTPEATCCPKRWPWKRRSRRLPRGALRRKPDRLPQQTPETPWKICLRPHQERQPRRK